MIRIRNIYFRRAAPLLALRPIRVPAPVHFLAWLLAALLPCAVMAQAFPSKPVRLIVPQTPGGATDVFARLVGQKLSAK